MKQILLIVLGITSIVLHSCKNQDKQEIVENNLPIDHHSFAEPQKAKVDHLDLSLNVDFDTKVLSGVATYTISKP